MDNTEAQKEELLVLQSIYDEKYFLVECLQPPCGRFSAEVQCSNPFFIKLRNQIISHTPAAMSDSSQSDYEEFEVKFLPPINLYFEYPESYPTDSPPAFLLSCPWLSYEQLSKLCKHLDILWKDGNGEVILFQWIQFLKEESLCFLGIEGYLDITELSKYKIKEDIMHSVPSNAQPSCNKNTPANNSGQNSQEKLKCLPEKKTNFFFMPSVKPSISGGSGSRDCRAFLDIADGKVLKNLLKEYNEFKKAEDFSNSWQLCIVCFSNKQGSEFVTFKACHHFFCKECVKSYFELMISEGNVHSLNCPYEKCNTQADSTLVKQIVSRAIFERYDSLLLARTLETMSDIAYCPRKACQCPLLIDVGERMGTCPACNFVFCPFCKMAYHGVAPCNFKATMKQEICNEYLQGDDNKKAELEMRHGKRTIRSLVEDVLSEKWIGSNSKPCPSCNASIEKTEGCNKMTCFKCGTFFCWLCSKTLKASNPYSHYSEKGTGCYDKLFPEDYVDEYMFEPGEFLNF